MKFAVHARNPAPQVKTGTARCESIKNVFLPALCSWAVAASVLTAYPLTANAENSTEATSSALQSILASNSDVVGGATTPIYFGNGCFWGRQKDFVDTEKSLGRDMGSVSSVVGYAGGGATSGSGKVCYYYSAPDTVYEKLGHAEVVQVAVRNDAMEDEFRAFAKTYFSQFQRTPLGMIRLDPQDKGAGYRNVIGIPGGVRSPLMKVLEEENVNKMELVEGKGNTYDKRGLFGSSAKEDDVINRVYILDTDSFPFYQAEMYHQFHNGIGKAFPAEYTRDLKNAAKQRGLISQTGCPEYPY